MSSFASINIKFLADLASFSTGMQNANRKIQKMGKNLQSVGTKLTVGVTAPLTAFAAVSLRNWDKQVKAIAQVEAGLRSTGGAVGYTSEQLQKMASDLQGTSLFGDEEILQGATAQLLTFTNIAGEQFGRTQQAVLDLSARLGTDLKSSAIQLGKALNDPVANLSALSRSGIQFSKEQKAVINSLVETNRLADAQTLILAELEKQYGGSAEAAAKAGLGPFKQLSNIIGDLQEDFGAIIAEAILPFAEKIKSLVTGFQNLSAPTKKFIVVLGGIAAAIGPLLALAGTILPAIATGFTLLTGPIGLVVAGVTAIGVVVAKNWAPIKQTLVDIANYFIDLYNESTGFRIVIESIILQFNNMWVVAKTVFKLLYELIKGVARQIVNQFSAMGAVIKGAFTLDFDEVKRGVANFGVATSENFSKVIDGFKTNFNNGFKEVAGNIQTSLDKVLRKDKYVMKNVTAEVTEVVAKTPLNPTKALKKKEATTLLGSSGLTTVGIKPLSDGLKNDSAEIDTTLSTTENRLEEFALAASEIVSSAAAATLAGFGEMIGGLLSGTVTMGDIAGSLMQTIGELAKSLGKAAIEIGVGMLAIKAAFKNPFAAIAAGVALVAIGTLISNAAKITSGDNRRNYAGAFADGGIVGGSSYYGDRLFARVNSGEMILNQRQQANMAALIGSGSSSAMDLNITLDGDLKGENMALAIKRYELKKSRRN